MEKLLLQLFAKSATQRYEESGESSHTEGGSHSETQGYSNTDSYGHSQTVGHQEGGAVSQGGDSSRGGTTSQGGSHAQGGSSALGGSTSQGGDHSEGGSHSTSGGKSWASGTVDEKTQAQRDKYTEDYQQSQKAQDAYQRLQDTLDQKPTFQSQYENRLNELYDSIMNREKFSYDFNADAMYQMYKDKYTQSGKKAMEDTMAQASILNGGYGSSYAQSAGQQTYQNYLQQLNDMLPTLRNQAYSEYQDEGNRMLQQYSLTNDAYNREYGQYRDSVSDWMNDRAFNQSNYQDERNFDYSQYMNDRNFWNQEYWNEKNAEQSNTQSSDATNWNDSSNWNNSSNWSDATNYSDSTNWNNTTNWNDSTNWNAQNNWNDSTSVTDTENHSYTKYGEVTDTSYWSDTTSNAWSNSLSGTFSAAAGSGGSGNGGNDGKITADDVKGMKKESDWYDSINRNISNSIRPDSKLKASDYSQYSEEAGSSKIVSTMDNPYKNNLTSDRNGISNLSDQDIMEMANIYRNSNSNSEDFQKLREYLSQLPQGDQQWFSYFLKNSVR